MRLLSLLSLSLVVACANTTGGALVTVPFDIGGVEGATNPMTFTTDAGWTVTLTEARIALGPFYFNISPPPTDAFRGGVVIVEATEQTVVDVLDPTMHALAASADGETGKAIAVEIDLFAPDPTQSLDDRTFLGSNVGRVVGTATKDGVTVAFDGPIAINQSLATAQKPLAALERVNGAVCDLTFTAAPQRLHLRVDPTHWFDAVDFSSLVGGTWDAHTTFGAELLANVQLTEGVYGLTVTSD